MQKKKKKGHLMSSVNCTAVSLIVCKATVSLITVFSNIWNRGRLGSHEAHIKPLNKLCDAFSPIQLLQSQMVPHEHWKERKEFFFRLSLKSFTSGMKSPTGLVIASQLTIWSAWTKQIKTRTAAQKPTSPLRFFLVKSQPMAGGRSGGGSRRGLRLVKCRRVAAFRDANDQETGERGRERETTQGAAESISHCSPIIVHRTNLHYPQS